VRGWWNLSVAALASGIVRYGCRVEALIHALVALPLAGLEPSSTPTGGAAMAGFSWPSPYDQFDIACLLTEPSAWRCVLQYSA
jgi:hypothetical protein